MKARATAPRWPPVSMLAALSIVALAAAATAPHERPARADGVAVKAPTGPFSRPAPGRNAVTVRATFPVPDFGVAAAYDRALGRRFTVGGEFEYVLPRVGYSHLTGWSETVNGRVWVGQPLHGVYFGASMSLSHQVLVDAPQLRRTALAPGAELGFRYTLPVGLSLGLSGGLRWTRLVRTESILCTREIHCAATRPGVAARLTADIGWVF
ncbi:MAG: hypothetical protein AAF721_19495 [Myxococcota bacterium]